MDDIEALLSEIRHELTAAGTPDGLPQRIAALRDHLSAEGVLAHSAAASPGGASEGAGAASAGSPAPLTRRPSMSVPFHIHRNAKFTDEVTLDARHWVHFHRYAQTTPFFVLPLSSF